MKSQSFLMALLPLVLSGCAWLSPDYDRPAFDMPTKWVANETQQGEQKEIERAWWKSYHDPVLDRLVDEALANNDSLAVAGARLQQAKAQYDYAFGNRFPLFAVVGEGSRSKMNFENNMLLSNAPSNIGFLGGMLSYEVDLWGKQASASSAAKAGYLATSHIQDATRLSIAAATVQLYFNLLALDADVGIMKNWVQTQEKTHVLVKKQYEVKAASALNLHQSEAGFAAVKAELPVLEDQRDKAESALATLLGRSPRQIIKEKLERGQGLDALPPPPRAPNDLPSDLLEKRPDIAAREQALIASHFNIGYARSAYFPTISLSNLLGVTSLDVANLYKGTVRTWSLGGSFAGPVIDFGRTDSGVDLALAENQEQLALYKESVRTAFKEVRDALSSQSSTRVAEEEQAAKEVSIKENLRLTNLRMTSGFASNLDVFTAERSFYEAQMARVSAKLNHLNSSVDLYKALGGGWSDNASEK